MIKKVISIILILILSLSLSTTATVIDTSTVDEDGYVTISGVVENVSTPQRITIMVLENGIDNETLGTIDTVEDLFKNVNYYKETVSDSDGNYSIKYKMVGNTSWYDVYVNAGTESATVSEKNFLYVKDVDKQKYIEEFNKVTITAENVAEYIFDNYDYIGFKESFFTELNEVEREKIACDFLSSRDLFYSGEFKSLDDIYQAYYLSLLVYSINNSENQTNISELIKNYGDISTLCTASFLKLCKKNIEKISEILQNEKPFDVKSFYETLGDESILEAIANVKTYNEIEIIITENSEYLGVSVDAYMKINDRSNINKTLIKRYGSISEFVEAFNKKVSAVKKTKPQTPSSGGGGSGGIGPVGISSGNPVTAPEENIQNKSKFDDMTEFVWAEESVEYLFEKGIISGVGNNKFEPARAVTREEFVKMVVMAFYEISENAVSNFNDVENGMWSYPYIATAQKLGIIKGSNGSFGIGNYIKREDVAVIIERIYGISEGGDISFGDMQMISPYAVTAVKTLGNLGIINGDLSGNFNPQSITTRAEAAKMIYEMLIKMKGENK